MKTTKQVQNISIIFMSAMLYTACAPKSSVQVDSKNPPIVEEVKKPSEVVQEEPINPLTLGGQPGVITVTGVAVKKDSSLDARLTVHARGGTGKIRNNKVTAAELVPESQPVITSENKEINLTAELEMKNIIAIGCEETLVQGLAKERGLEIATTPKPMTEQILSIRAKTLVLCGNLSEITLPYISLTAEEVILNEVSYTKAGSFGAVRLIANKLSLIGKSTIEVKGIDGENTYAATAPSLELHVMKEIVASKEGHLSLIATGASYKAPAKKD